MITLTTKSSVLYSGTSIKDRQWLNRSPGRDRAARYERLFSHLGLMYRTIPSDEKGTSDHDFFVLVTA